MKLLLLAVVIGIKILFCKAIALGLVLLTFLIIEKKLHLKRQAEGWDDFFIKLPANKVQIYAIITYLLAAGLSSVLAYILFSAFNFQYRLYLTFALFGIGLVITGCRYITKGKGYIVTKFQGVKDFLKNEKAEQEEEK